MDPNEESARLEQIFAQAGQVPQPDPRQPSDPVLTEMVRLAQERSAARGDALEPYLADWIRRGLPRLQVAHYLAAAGLGREEGLALEARIRARVESRLRRKAYASLGQGATLIALGAAAAVSKVLPIWALLLIVAVCLGLWRIALGLQQLRRLAPPPED